MGAIIGKTDAPEPYFVQLKSNGYEVRQYNSYFVAETRNESSNKAFTTLAKYIGVIGSTPENRQSKVIYANQEYVLH
jgi:hypothetical protein